MRGHLGRWAEERRGPRDEREAAAADEGHRHQRTARSVANDVAIEVNMEGLLVCLSCPIRFVARFLPTVVGVETTTALRAVEPGSTVTGCFFTIAGWRGNY